MFFLWKCAIFFKKTLWKCAIRHNAQVKIVLTRRIHNVSVKQAFGDFLLDICSWKHLEI
jgi:hypothetical protein